MSIASVVIDSREPDHIKQLTFGSVPVAVTQLDAGDLMLACSDGSIILIERKTAGDFLNTLRDDRLFPQVAKLRLASQWSYLAICGDLRPGPNGVCYRDGQPTGWNWSSVTGAFLSVQELGVPILFVGSDVEYEAAIIRLANRDRSGMTIPPVRDGVMMSEAEAILTSLPGIGPDKAKVLIDYCGSAAWALYYLTEPKWEGPTAPGIAEGIKRKVRQALGLADGEALHVIHRESGEILRMQRVKESAA